MKKNEVLEIVPGDRISVTYKDPKAITKEREIQEAFMTATFSNADISAAFVEFETDHRGNRVPIYIPMRRFKDFGNASSMPGDTTRCCHFSTSRSDRNRLRRALGTLPSTTPCKPPRKMELRPGMPLAAAATRWRNVSRSRGQLCLVRASFARSA